MGKVVVWNLMTLDGCFEGPEPWDLAFHELAWGPELRELSLEFGATAEALVFGRKTYEGMADYWPNARGGGGQGVHERAAEARRLADADGARRGTTAGRRRTSWASFGR